MKNCLFSILLIAFIQLNAQNDSAYKSIPIPILNSKLALDNLGNSYVFNTTNIIKYSPDGDSIGTYSNNRLGNINYIDVSNPYKILVFYSDYSNIVFLDNFLSMIDRPLEISQLGFDAVTLACSSQDNGMWFFNRLTQVLVKVDKDLNITNQSLNLSQYFGKRIEPSYLIEQNSTLLLQIPNEYVLTFDQFGTIDTKKEIKTDKKIQYINKNIIYQEGDSLLQISNISNNIISIALPLKNADYAKISKERLAIIKNNTLYLYHFKGNKND